MPPGDFLKYVKDQYDRLAELSPPIPGSVAREFSTKMKDYNDISKPEETNGLNKIEIFVDSAHELGGTAAPMSPPPVTPKVVVAKVPTKPTA
jgi:hypothetical protein